MKSNPYVLSNDVKIHAMDHSILDMLQPNREELNEALMWVAKAPYQLKRLQELMTTEEYENFIHPVHSDSYTFNVVMDYDDASMHVRVYGLDELPVIHQVFNMACRSSEPNDRAQVIGFMKQQAKENPSLDKLMACRYLADWLTNITATYMETRARQYRLHTIPTSEEELQHFASVIIE